jgi:predicted ATPase
MIKELKLTNWKSFKEATLYIDPLTILIGANASGKSNALDALFFMQLVYSRLWIDISHVINGNSDYSGIRGGMEWICLKPNKQFTLEFVIDSSNNSQDYRYELTVLINDARAEIAEEKLTLLTYKQSQKTPEEKILFVTKPRVIDYKTTFFSTIGNSKNLTVIFDERYQRPSLPEIVYYDTQLPWQDSIKEDVKYVLSQFQKIFVFDPIPSHMRSYSKLSENLQPDGSNIAGVLANLKGNQKTEVEATLTNYLKALPERDIKRVWAETVGRLGSDAMLYCEEGWEDTVSHEIDARGMSDGTLRYLAIVTALLTRERGSLLVIEEVDNGLHPSRAHVLIDMLKTLGKERGIDVIVTTHNPALLDAAGVRMLPFITVAHRDDKTGASQLIQLEDIQQLPKMMASGSIGKLNSEGRIESALKQDDAK